MHLQHLVPSSPSLSACSSYFVGFHHNSRSQSGPYRSPMVPTQLVSTVDPMPVRRTPCRPSSRCTGAWATPSPTRSASTSGERVLAGRWLMLTVGCPGSVTCPRASTGSSGRSSWPSGLTTRSPMYHSSLKWASRRRGFRAISSAVFSTSKGSLNENSFTFEHASLQHCWIWPPPPNPLPHSVFPLTITNILMHHKEPHNFGFGLFPPPPYGKKHKFIGLDLGSYC